MIKSLTVNRQKEKSNLNNKLNDKSTLKQGKNFNVNINVYVTYEMERNETKL